MCGVVRKDEAKWLISQCFFTYDKAIKDTYLAVSDAPQKNDSLLLIRSVGKLCIKFKIKGVENIIQILRPKKTDNF